MRVTAYEIRSAFWRSDMPLRIAHLSDLHNQRSRGVLESIKSIAPDVIAITGDFFEGSVSTSPRSLDLLRELLKVSPVYFSLGNHEYEVTAEEKEALRAMGVTLLDNSYEDVDGIRFGGLTSSYLLDLQTKSSVFRTAPPPKPDLTWLTDFEDTDSFKILLCHHPEYYAEYLRERRADVVLSGHAHGGQIEIAGRGVIAPGQGLFPKYTWGVHENRLVISRGLANTFPLVPRLGNEREIVVLTIRKP